MRRVRGNPVPEDAVWLRELRPGRRAKWRRLRLGPAHVLEIHGTTRTRAIGLPGSVLRFRPTLASNAPPAMDIPPSPIAHLAPRDMRYRHGFEIQPAQGAEREARSWHFACASARETDRWLHVLRQEAAATGTGWLECLRPQSGRVAVQCRWFTLDKESGTLLFYECPASLSRASRPLGTVRLALGAQAGQVVPLAVSRTTSAPNRAGGAGPGAQSSLGHHPAGAVEFGAADVLRATLGRTLDDRPWCFAVRTSSEGLLRPLDWQLFSAATEGEMDRWIGAIQELGSPPADVPSEDVTHGTAAAGDEECTGVVHGDAAVPADGGAAAPQQAHEDRRPCPWDPERDGSPRACTESNRTRADSKDPSGESSDASTDVPFQVAYKTPCVSGGCRSSDDLSSESSCPNQAQEPSWCRTRQLTSCVQRQGRAGGATVPQLNLATLADKASFASLATPTRNVSSAESGASKGAAPKGSTPKGTVIKINRPMPKLDLEGPASCDCNIDGRSSQMSTTDDESPRRPHRPETLASLTTRRKGREFNRGAQKVLNDLPGVREDECLSFRGMRVGETPLRSATARPREADAAAATTDTEEEEPGPPSDTDVNSGSDFGELSARTASSRAHLACSSAPPSSDLPTARLATHKRLERLSQRARDDESKIMHKVHQARDQAVHTMRYFGQTLPPTSDKPEDVVLFAHGLQVFLQAVHEFIQQMTMAWKEIDAQQQVRWRQGLGDLSCPSPNSFEKLDSLD